MYSIVRNQLEPSNQPMYHSNFVVVKSLVKLSVFGQT